MRAAIFCLLVTIAATAQLLPHDDAIRIAEFYRLASQTQDEIWPGWSKTPAPLLLVTEEVEFLTHHPAPPRDFTEVADGVYARPRQFGTGMLATFPALGQPSVIVIGEPRNTEAKTSTPWVITVMHEHFHQLQDGQPGYDEAVKGLGLSGGDTSGMWMLNYPFPYEKSEVVQGFARLRDLLLQALGATDRKEFEKVAMEYVGERKGVFRQLSADDHRYFSFQLWKEGIARYTQIKAAEAAARYRPTPEYAALPDYESFAAYAARARAETLKELRQADLAKMRRVVVYSFGAAEGLLLDRMNPGWKNEYFHRPLSTDYWFEGKKK